MAGGYQVGIASETKAFKQGIESGVIDPLEDAQKELLDLGKNKGPEQLERSLKDAQKATERLGDETKDTARAIEREFRDSYRKVKESSEDGTSKARENMSEVKQEALQNLSEVTSSFNGDMSSVTDLIQGTLGGLAGSIPGIGLLAGAAAVGVGAIAAAFGANDEAAEQSRQRAAEWAQAYIDAGSLIVSTATQTANVMAISTDPERYKEAQENAKNWGVDVSTAMNAMAGNATALSVAQDQLAETDRRVHEELQGMGTQYQDIADDLDGFAQRTFLGKEAMKRLTDEMDAGKVTASQVSESFKRIVQDSADAAVEVDELGNKLITLPDNTQVFIDAQTGLASQAIARFKGDADGAIDHVNGRQAIIRVGVDDSAWRNWQPVEKNGRVTAYIDKQGLGRQVWD
ncbi:hypothetical protein JCM13591A_19760 [Microbacterium xylanilyticum]